MKIYSSIKNNVESVVAHCWNIEGPSRIIGSSEISHVTQCSTQFLLEKSSFDFDLPNVNQPQLIDFYRQHAHIESPSVCKLSIKNASVYGSTNVLVNNAQALVGDLSYEFGMKHDCHTLLKSRIQPARYLKGSAFAFAVQGGASYYHWMIEEVPRILASLPNNCDYLIYDYLSYSRLDLLRFIQRHMPFSFKRVIRSRRLSKHFICENLNVANYVDTPGYPGMNTLRLLDRLSDCVPHEYSFTHEKFIISRRSNLGRSLQEADLFISKLTDQGFVVVYLEDFSFCQQVNLFRTAKEIIATHGAGLANLVFCKSRPIVIELFDSRYVHWCFWHLSQLVKAHYIPISLPLDANIEHNGAFSKCHVCLSGHSEFFEYYRKLGLNL